MGWKMSCEHRGVAPTPTGAIGLPDFSAQVVGREALLWRIHGHATLLLGKPWGHLGGDRSVLHRHLQCEVEEDISS